MNDYISLRVDATPCSEVVTDLVADALADIGFESFVPDDTGVTAFINASLYSKEKALEALADFPLETEFSLSDDFIEGRDWNSEWEKNFFKPIVIGGQCVVHSSFHHDYPSARYDIVIDPKMAFGTGHHSTTTLMLKFILASDMEGKTVIDMGTGTGILSILCSMRGAAKVTGIEIDEGAWLNALENRTLNHVGVDFINGDASALDPLEPADYFFANINRNVITSDFGAYAAKVGDCGRMFLSGFYTEDVPVIEKCAAEHGFRIEEMAEDNNWCGLKLCR